MKEFIFILIFFIYTFLSLNLIVGLFRPPLLFRIYKKEFTRKQIAIIFGISSFGAFLIMGLVAQTIPRAQNETGEVAVYTPTPSNTPSPVESPSAIPASAPTPTITPTPSPKLSLKTQIENKINEILGSQTNTNKPRIISVGESIDYGGGVAISINGDENISKDWTKNGMWQSSTELLKEIPKLDDRIPKISIAIFYPLNDVKGNTEDTKVMQVEMEKSTWVSINWSNFQISNIPKVADYYYEHPAFK